MECIWVMLNNDCHYRPPAVLPVSLRPDTVRTPVSPRPDTIPTCDYLKSPCPLRQSLDDANSIAECHNNSRLTFSCGQGLQKVMMMMGALHFHTTVHTN